MFTMRHGPNCYISRVLDVSLAQAVSCRPLTAEAGVRSQVGPCDICGRQSGTGTDSSPSTSVFPWQYHYTNSPYSSPSTYSCYQKEKRENPRNLPDRNSMI
jgi:hypothetical protein